jgi:hypothetical protein
MMASRKSMMARKQSKRRSMTLTNNGSSKEFVGKMTD